MAVPYHTVATALKTILDGEFTDLTITAVHDKIHESLGYRRVEVGISPVRESATTGREIQMTSTVLIQWYDLWDKEIDNEQVVNPFLITERADRLRRAIETASAAIAGTPEIWYFKVDNTEYPDDPTGNKSRFEMTVTAYGDNTALTQRL
jgi:hypothetical protein